MRGTRRCPLIARFDLFPVASPIHDAAALETIVARYRDVVERLGGRLVDVLDPSGPPTMLFVLTGGTEHRILELWDRELGRHRFVTLAAHPDQNSLPAALEALARIRQLGGRGRIVYLPGPDRAAPLLDEAVHDLAVDDRLRRTRIGLIGQPSDWLVASNPDPKIVRRVWGPELVSIDLERVYDRFSPDAAMAADLLSGAAASDRPLGEMDRAGGIYDALRDLIDEERLDSISLRCFDLISVLGTTGCVALSELNDEGLTAGCEGDVVSTVGMLWTRLLLGTVPWMANPARIDVDASTVLLAHCTVPRKLVTSYRLETHFESDRGVGIDGTIPPGPVTLLRIGGKELDRLWLSQGTIVPSEHPDGLCRTQMTVEVTEGDGLDQVLDDPLGNHIVAVVGHHAERLRAWWRRFVAPVD